MPGKQTTNKHAKNTY